MTFMSTCSGPITGQVAGKPALKFLRNPPKGPRVGHESLDLDEETFKSLSDLHTDASRYRGLCLFCPKRAPASRRTHRGQQLFENCDARHAFGQLMSLSPALCLPAVVIKTGAERRLG